MALVLDAGALVGLQRRDRRLVALVKAAEEDGTDLRTVAPVVGQVWRGGTGRQALLARYVQGIDVVPADARRCRAAGLLLGASGTADVVDALVVGVALAHDEILTSDPQDIRRLADAGAVPVLITRV